MGFPVRLLADASRLTQVPVISAQFSVCLDSYDAVLGGAGKARALFVATLNEQIEQARASLAGDKTLNALAGMFPVSPNKPDVRIACPGPTLPTRVGVWLQPAFGSAHGLLRNEQVDRIEVLSSPKRQALRLDRDTLLGFVQAVWDQFTSQDSRINSHGNPDHEGNTELRRWALDSPTTKSMRLVIGGTYHKTFGPISLDVDFELTVVETFEVLQTSAGAVITSSTSHDLWIDRSNIQLTEAGILFISMFFGIPGFGVFASLYAMVEGEVRSALAGIAIPNLSLGKLVLKVVPRQVLIPGPSRKKLVFGFDDIEVSLGPDGKGILFTGSNDPELVLRTPYLAIFGPHEFKLNTALAIPATRTGEYFTGTADMRAPMTASWTAQGSVAKPTALKTNITFSTAGAPKTKKVSVTVTDADGTTLAATMNVAITLFHAVAPRPPTRTPRLTVKGR